MVWRAGVRPAGRPTAALVPGTCTAAAVAVVIPAGLPAVLPAGPRLTAAGRRPLLRLLSRARVLAGRCVRVAHGS